MNSRELIDAIKAADPGLSREVWLHVHDSVDVAGAVVVDDAGDLVIDGEEAL